MIVVKIIKINIILLVDVCVFFFLCLYFFDNKLNEFDINE